METLKQIAIASLLVFFFWAATVLVTLIFN